MELTSTITIGSLFRNKKTNRLWRVTNIFIDERGIVRVKVMEEENDIGEPSQRLFTGDKLRLMLGTEGGLVRKNTDEEAKNWGE